ncbi:MAG: glycosyltransferase family 4 protein [Lachnospiraceae bacterium]|nr:glycosyltransferase family 4 protein [Lachnospiraceae bacterium]
MSKYDLVILVNEKHKKVFEPFEGEASIVVCSDDTGVLKAVWKAFTCCFRFRVKYVFPLMPFGFLKLFGITPVSWIADFQHCHYPEFFEQEEVDKRNSNFKKIASSGNPLVLSSNDAKEDLEQYFRAGRPGVHVVHFSSFIDDELGKLTPEHESEVLSGFGLEKHKYIAVCNQFWKHKNHIVVLKAIGLLADRDTGSDLKVVFTGEPSDRRNPEYMDELKKLMDALGDRVQVLGFIDRRDQLCIMKYAGFIIQPSLFEGWGTVVEDAKILGKRILLSDIPVHREQMNENCILFDPKDPESLADAVIRMSKEGFAQDPASCDMTAEYAKALTDVFV